MSQDLFLWAATVRSKSLEERVEAARAGGFTRLSLFPADYRAARERGLSDDDIRAMHDDAGVRLTTIDPLTRWVPRWQTPPDMDADRARMVGFAVEEVLDIAARLELETVTANEAWAADYTDDELVDAFGAFCDQAGDAGLRVHLEFTPFSAIPDLARAWEIVRRADRPNGGLVFDTWHYFRGTPDDALLDSVPGDRIFFVQVSDAAAKPQGPLVVDTWNRRQPGEGDLPLTGVLERLAAKPGIGPAGAEVLSPELMEQPAAAIGARCGDLLRAVLPSPWGGQGA